MNIFDLSLQINGFPIKKAELKLKELQTLDLRSFLRNQEQEMFEIFAYHRGNNVHYDAFCIGEEYKSWEEVPILTKESNTRPLGERFSKGFTTRNSHVGHTSGSSGQPFYFAKDKFCHAMTWAVIKDRFGRHGLDFNRSMQARFYGIPLNSKVKYYEEKLKDFLCYRKRFPIFDLSDVVLENYLKEFKKRKFNYLNGYANSLVFFADFLKRKGVVLKTICPSLQCCVTTSDICDSIDRSKMEKSFGVPVVNEYGASELDIIAFEDENYDWILNEETLYVEVVDDDGKVLPDGIEGRILITSLYNKAMPFIRYDVGDIGVISKRRKGNYRILEKLVGRTDDIGRLPSGKKFSGHTLYYITKSVFLRCRCVKEFIIKQMAPAHFHFEYVSSERLNNNEVQEINKLMDMYLEQNLKTTFERKISLIKTQAGKFKHFSVVYT